MADSGRRAAPLSRARPQRVPRRRAPCRQQARRDRAQLRFPAVAYADQHRRGDARVPRRRGQAAAFRYRPLTVDPDVAKRDLYAIDLTLLEDPTLERLSAAKRRELDYQLTMLGDAQHAGVPAGVDAPLRRGRPALLGDAHAILAANARRRRRVARSSAPRKSPRPRARWSRATGAPTRRFDARSRCATTSPGCWSRAAN